MIPWVCSRTRWRAEHAHSCHVDVAGSDTTGSCCSAIRCADSLQLQRDECCVGGQILCTRGSACHLLRDRIHSRCAPPCGGTGNSDCAGSCLVSSGRFLFCFRMQSRGWMLHLTSTLHLGAYRFNRSLLLPPQPNCVLQAMHNWSNRDDRSNHDVHF